MLVNAGNDPPDWFIGACTASSRFLNAFFTVFAAYHCTIGINYRRRFPGRIGGLGVEFGGIRRDAAGHHDANSASAFPLTIQAPCYSLSLGR
jgi:hypothetical protein